MILAIFAYKGLNARGKDIRGLIEAENTRSARDKLRQQSIFPTSLEETVSQKQSKKLFGRISLPERRRISTSQLAVITRQFATLVSAGMPLVEALRALGEQLDQASLKQVFSDVCDQVNEGSTLHRALENYPEIFPKLYVNMIASAEASGMLDVVLGRLADLLESQALLRRKVLSALTYPALMIILCVGVVTLLLAYVIPPITAILKERGRPLPFPTLVVSGLSDFLRDYWWLAFFMLFMFFFLLKLYLRSERGRRKFDTWILKVPIFGPLRLNLATSRLAMNLGLMLSSGIEMLTALGISKNTIGNVVLEDIVDDAIVGVREGKSLASQLNNTERFPRLLIHMVAIGERTGQLEEMLVRAGKTFESEVDTVISGLTSIIEPLLIILLAFIVAGILFSVMLPMLEITSIGR